jgi:hypothetical protein
MAVYLIESNRWAKERWAAIRDNYPEQFANLEARVEEFTRRGRSAADT